MSANGQEPHSDLLNAIGDWPYAEEELLRLLNPDLIERHASAQLSRALNIGRVIAVVGSGVTNAYGRPAWKQLLRDYRHFLEDLYQRLFGPNASARVEPDPEVESLRRAQIDLGLSPPDKPYRGDYAIAFQVCEALEAALQRVPGSDLESGAFRKQVQQDLFDERGHCRIFLNTLKRSLERFCSAYSLPDVALAEAAGKLADAIAPSYADLTRDRIVPASQSSDVKRRRALRLYSPATIRSTCEAAPLLMAGFPGGGREVTELCKQVEKFAEIYAQPNLRFVSEGLLGLAAALMSLRGDSVPPEPGALIAAAFDIPDPAAASANSRLDWPEGQPMRAQLNPQHRDPLTVLHDRLGIDRFLTTNFDNEIEMLLADRGSTFDPDQAGMEDATRTERDGQVNVLNILGRRGKDVVFDQDRVLDMIDFGVHGIRSRKQVMHLHGRALRGANMVLTEQDYQDLYLRSEGPRDLVDEALALTFGSNPLLFVGLGMREPDILRPLRTFNSQRANLTDRVGVALLPHLKALLPPEIEKRRRDGEPASDLNDRSYREEKIEHLTRFGVYAIHYGSAATSADQPESRDALAKLVSSAIWLEREATRLAGSLLSLEELSVDAADADIAKKIAALEKCRDLSSSEYIWKQVHEPPPRFYKIETFQGDDFPMEVELSIFRTTIDWMMACCNAVALHFDLDGSAKRNELGEAAYPEEHIEKFRKRLASGKHKLARAALVAQLGVIINNLQGLEEAFVTPFFVARVAKLEREWLSWKENWTRLPAPRPPSISWDGSTSGPVWNYRHRVALRNLHEECDIARARVRMLEAGGRYDPWEDRLADCYLDAPDASTPRLRAARSSDRFFEAAPPPSMASFLRALEEGAGGPESGRRIVAILARRGVGKGQLFSALRSNERFADLAFALGLIPGFQGQHRRLSNKLRDENWAEHQIVGREATKGIHRMSVDLGLSYEVLSVFDQVTQFFFKCLGVMDPSSRDTSEKAMSLWENDRLGALRYVLGALSRLKPSKQRIVLTLNSVSVFFNPNGQPKNAQVGRLFDCLVSEEWRESPIDIVMFVREEVVPSYLRRDRGAGVSSAAWTVLGSGLMDERERAEQLERLKTAGIPQTSLKSAAASRHFVMLLSDVRPTSFAARFFPMTALALAWPEVKRAVWQRLVHWAEGERDEKISWRANVTGPSRAFEWDAWPDSVLFYQERIRGIFEYLVLDRQHSLSGDKIEELMADTFCMWIMQDLACRDEGGAERRGQWASVRRRLKVRRKFFRNRLQHYLDGVEGDRALLGSMLSESLFGVLAADAAGLGETFISGRDAVLNQFNELCQQVGAHRFGLSVALAAFDNVLSSELRKSHFLQRDVDDPDWREDPTSRRRREDADRDGRSFAFEQFLERSEILKTGLDLRTGYHFHDAREDRLVEKALVVFEQLHDARSPWPFAPRSPDKAEGVNLDAVEFCRRLERANGEALFLLQQALLVDLTLVGQPTVARVLMETPRTSAQLRRLCVLTFGSAGNDSLREAVLNRALDLLVHRCLVFRVAPKEREGEFRFAVHKALKRVMNQRFSMPLVDLAQVDQLSVTLYAAQPNDLPKPSAEAYGQISAMIEKLVEYRRVLFDPAGAGGDLPLVSDKLRAAYGVLRSTCTLGVISRFDASAGGEETAPKGGYIENHRLLIRWMLRQASVMNTEGKAGRYRPFYAEEVAWLYNECALLSFVQGKLYDASALFLQAERMVAKSVEKHRKDGALGARVGLNKALCDIERGQPRGAREFLSALHAREDENPTLRAIAGGYVGWLDHLQGNFDAAYEHYHAAESELANLNQYRGASIFARHTADLLRRRGEGDWLRAHDASKRAVQHALNGNHEDVRQMAVMSRVRLGIETRELDVAEAARELAKVEKYASVIGMPRLLVDAYTLRGVMLWRQGETTLAANTTMMSLRLSTRLGLHLKTVIGLLNLAGMQLGGDRADPQVIVGLATEMASKFEFHAARGSLGIRSD